MKRNAFPLLSLLLCLGCIHEDVSDPDGVKLLRITVNGKTDQSFEYDAGRLVKENFFNSCTNPSDEFVYSYQNGKLKSITATLRGFYSSIGATCDPASGINTVEHFEYDAEGKISRIIRANTYTEFHYNTRKLVENQILYNGQSSFEATYKYDPFGNLSEVSDQNGKTTHYEYDNKLNPYYLMNQKPGWIGAFNKSPNNVLKATGQQNFVRSFTYNDLNLPSEVVDDNGLTYLYVYE